MNPYTLQVTLRADQCLSPDDLTELVHDRLETWPCGPVIQVETVEVVTEVACKPTSTT